MHTWVEITGFRKIISEDVPTYEIVEVVYQHDHRHHIHLRVEERNDVVGQYDVHLCILSHSKFVKGCLESFKSHRALVLFFEPFEAFFFVVEDGDHVVGMKR